MSDNPQSLGTQQENDVASKNSRIVEKNWKDMDFVFEYFSGLNPGVCERRKARGLFVFQ